MYPSSTELRREDPAPKLLSPFIDRVLLEREWPLTMPPIAVVGMSSPSSMFKVDELYRMIISILDTN